MFHIYVASVCSRCFNYCIRMLHSCVSYCTSFMLFGESRARGVMVAWRGHRECPRVLTSGPLLLWRKKARFLMAWPRYTCLFRKDDIPCCYLHWVAVYTKLPNEKKIRFPVLYFEWTDFHHLKREKLHIRHYGIDYT
jgi:hypothetical protein